MDKQVSVKEAVAKTLILGCLILTAVWTIGAVRSNANLAKHWSTDTSVAAASQSGALWLDLYNSASAAISNPFGALLAILRLNPFEADVFTSLPENYARDSLSANLFIKLIVINTNPGSRVECRQAPYPYEFLVLFVDGSIILESACGQGGDKYDYGIEITRYLNQSKGLPAFTREELFDVKIIIGDGQKALKNLIDV